MICGKCYANLDNDSDRYKIIGCKHTMHKKCLKLAIETQMK